MIEPGELKIVFFMTIGVIILSLFFLFFKKKTNFKFINIKKISFNLNLIPFVILLVFFIYLYSIREISEFHNYRGDGLTYKLAFLYNKDMNFEFGYQYISNLIRNLTNKYEIFLFFCGSIMSLSFINLFKNIKENRFTILSLMCISAIFITGFCIFRSILAVFIAFNVYAFLYKKKYLLATIFALLSISIHFSGIIMLPIIVLNYYLDKKNKIKEGLIIIILIAFFILSMIIAKFFPNFFTDTRYSVYLNNGTLGVGNLIIFTFSIFMVIKNYKTLINNNPINKIFFISICCFTLIIPLQLYARSFYRMYYFLLPPMYFVLSDLMSIYLKKNKMIFMFILLIFLYEYLYAMLNLNYY